MNLAFHPRTLDRDRCGRENSTWKSRLVARVFETLFRTREIPLDKRKIKSFDGPLLYLTVRMIFSNQHPDFHDSTRFQVVWGHCKSIVGKGKTC